MVRWQQRGDPWSGRPKRWVPFTWFRSLTLWSPTGALTWPNTSAQPHMHSPTLSRSLTRSHPRSLTHSHHSRDSSLAPSHTRRSPHLSLSTTGCHFLRPMVAFIASHRPSLPRNLPSGWQWLTLTAAEGRERVSSRACSLNSYMGAKPVPTRAVLATPPASASTNAMHTAQGRRSVRAWTSRHPRV